MFEDQLKNQLAQLVKTPQWKSLKSLEVELEKEIKDARESKDSDSMDVIAHRAITRDGKIDGMRYLINKAEQRANKMGE